jgi:F-type H+-transporting ATPase subunit b
MRRRTALVFLMLIFATGTFSFYPLHAQEPETAHAEGATEHEESWVRVVGRWFNFFALIAILYFFLARSLRVQDKFKSEAEEIQRSIESARQAKEEAEKRMAEMDQRMSQLNEDISRIRTQATLEAEEERKRILESAQKEAERIVDLAHRDMENEVRLARKELRKQVANLAVEQGRKIIEEQINEDDQKRLIDSYIGEFKG